MSEPSRNKPRRRFLVLLGGAFVSGVALSFSRWWTPPFESLLKQHTHFLKLAGGTARAFRREYQERMVSAYGQKAWDEHVEGLANGSVTFPLGLFLMSTDFFLNGADEKKTVRYIGYYDPIHSCQNPFSDFSL